MTFPGPSETAVPPKTGSAPAEMSRSLCRPGLEPPRAAMVLPAALGIVLTAGLGLGSIAVPPTAGADELNPSTTQTSEAVPAAPNEAEASHPQADRVIDKIVGGSERGDEKGLPGVSDAPGADAAADDASDAQRRDGDVADRRVEEKPEPAQPKVIAERSAESNALGRVIGGHIISPMTRREITTETIIFVCWLFSSLRRRASISSTSGSSIRRS